MINPKLQQKTRFFCIAGLFMLVLLAAVACKEKKTPEEILCEQMMYQPYSIEHYELRTFPDTGIVIYFNREVTEKDCHIHMQHDFKNDSDSTVLTLEYLLPLKKSKNRTLVYKFPLRDSIKNKHNGFASAENFSAENLNYFKGKYKDVRVLIYPGFPNVPAANFKSDNRFYPPWVFLRFNEKDNIAAREKMCYLDLDKSYLWGLDLLRNYNGQFDSTGRKQGYWRWHYSSGTIMAEGDFKDDTLCSDLKLYNFKGKYYHTISAKYINENNRPRREQ